MIKNLSKCSYINFDIIEKLFSTKYYMTLEEFLKRNSIKYNAYGSECIISFYELIENFYLIDFDFLLKHLTSPKYLNWDFIRIFRLDETHIQTLSECLRFENHEGIICQLAETLNWEILINQNKNISFENFSKYYKYMIRNLDFLYDFNRIFSAKHIIQIFKNEMLSYVMGVRDIVGNFREVLDTIFQHHKLSIDELNFLVKEIKKFKKELTTEKEINFYNFSIYYIKNLILETQDYDETFIIKHKSFFGKNQIKNACKYGRYSESFIEENKDNEKFINWENLSSNKNLTSGFYSLSFYLKFSDRIKWEIFTYDQALDLFYKNDPEKFKKFLIKIKDKLPKDELIRQLSRSLRDEHGWINADFSIFSITELIKYFEKEILEIKKFYFYNTSNNFIVACIKLGNKNFNIIDFIESIDSTRITDNFIQLFKKDIFELILDEEKMKKLRKPYILKEITNKIEEMKGEK